MGVLDPLRAVAAANPVRWLGPPPVNAAGRFWTVATSLDDLVPAPTPELMRVALAAVTAANQVSLPEVVERAPRADQRKWIEQWPGEHYRLLRALRDVVEPDLVVEVGTFHGLGTLSLAGKGRVVTYDIVPWREIPDSALRESDFAGDAIEQRLGDLSDPDVFAREREVLAAADLLLIDAPKDGVFEPAFLDLLVPILKPGAVVVLDDTHFMEMVQLWRDLPLPKLDVTSFGHWAGTGLAIKPS